MHCNAPQPHHCYCCCHHHQVAYMLLHCCHCHLLLLMLMTMLLFQLEFIVIIIVIATMMTMMKLQGRKATTKSSINLMQHKGDVLCKGGQQSSWAMALSHAIKEHFK